VKRLWLLRHAKSSWDEPGLADHDRPLAPRGRKASKRIRTWAAEHDVRPGLVLCSTAVRARATLDLVAKGLGEPVIELEAGLYHAWESDLLARVCRVPGDVDELLLVGHNPGFENLVALLAPPGVEAFPTGALAELRLAIDDWSDAVPGCGELVQLVLPRELPG
jgi:phosphohistidine phosphatase